MPRSGYYRVAKVASNAKQDKYSNYCLPLSGKPTLERNVVHNRGNLIAIYPNRAILSSEHPSVVTNRYYSFVLSQHVSFPFR